MSIRLSRRKTLILSAAGAVSLGTRLAAQQEGLRLAFIPQENPEKLLGDIAAITEWLAGQLGVPDEGLGTIDHAVAVQARRDSDGANSRQRRRFGRRGGRGRGRGGYGSIVDAGPVLFALTPTGQLTVFEANAEEFKQLASYKVAESGTYAYPIVAGNRLFIKDDNAVTLWTIE